MEAYQELAKITKAIAHPTRLRILEILGQGEACVCHMTHLLGQRQPYISQQLMTLREAGLVRDRKDGVMVYYSLTCDCVGDVIASMHRLLRATGVEVEFAPTPLAPVEVEFAPTPLAPVSGCPCPVCGGEGSCSV